MEILVDRAAYEEKSVVRNLMELYKYDFTEFDPEDVNEHGLYEYMYLDNYWTEEGRHPFLIRVDNKLAGFALIRVIEFGSEEHTYSMSEFFVLKKYRGKAVGRTAAVKLFEMFEGKWKVAQIEENKPAQSFWRKVVENYTGGNYEEIREDNWSGPIQVFFSKK